MIRKIGLCYARGFDPYANLALERWLLEHVEEDQCILYLWQNQNTVVIGKNQNPWAECRVAELEADGGKLARRMSGGGAVFHDLGNLNFTFLVPEDAYDLDRQLLVIQRACALAGIPTERSGRNDVLTQGRKFSGNAFYHGQGRAYHHGTILIHADSQKLQKYLTPPKAKLEAKGVSSVRSRIINLRELQPELTCETMKAYLSQAFTEVYGLSAVQIPVPDDKTLESFRSTFSSWEYLFGKPLPFQLECQRKFPWGYIQLQIQVHSGILQQLNVYTDAMDWTLSDQIRSALSGCPLSRDAIKKALLPLDPVISEDILTLLSQEIL